MCVLTCMFVFDMGTWYPRKSRQDVRSPGTGVTYDCEKSHGYWKLNPDPLPEQQVLLTAEPSLYPSLCPYTVFWLFYIGLYLQIKVSWALFHSSVSLSAGKYVDPKKGYDLRPATVFTLDHVRNEIQTT